MARCQRCGKHAADPRHTKDTCQCDRNIIEYASRILDAMERQGDEDVEAVAKRVKSWPDYLHDDILNVVYGMGGS